MTPERWHQITAVFQSAVTCEPEARAAVVEAACHDDRELWADVQALLIAHDRAGPGGRTPLFGVSRLTSSLGAAPDAATLLPGTRLADRFSIVRALGEGGMGTVYEATDDRLGRRVALKCAHPGYRHRLAPEARAAREVSHFNVCKMHDLHAATVDAGEVDFLSMELVEGETLSQRIARDGPLDPALARTIALQVCDGLAQAHRQTVIHGDLKCPNVILGRSAQGEMRAVITDFGLAHLSFDSDIGERGGTRAYMAPELVGGARATVASDIYALGVIFHVMLTGHPPLGSESQGETVAALPSPWDSVVARCIDAHPDKRPASVEEVSAAFKPVRWRMKTAAALAAAAILAFSLRPTAPEPRGEPVRLLVLPLHAPAGDPARPGNRAGVGAAVAARLAGARRNFTVIPPAEAQANRVETPDQGRSVLGATHALDTRMTTEGADVAVKTSLIDLQTGRTLRELTARYPSDDSQLVTRALVGMVTEAFRLPPARGADDALEGAAGTAYSEGMALLRDGGASGAKAIPYFEKAIALSPWSALPYAGLAESQLQLFEADGGPWLDRAQASVARAKSLDAASLPVLLASGTLAQQYGRYEDAIRDFSLVTERDPTDSEAWRRLALAYERSNRSEDVAATFEKAIQAQPGYYRHYLSFGNFYLTRGQFDRAEALYRKVTEVAPGLAAGHTNLGLALLPQGRFAEAESELLTALRIRESPGLLLNIGALYYAQESFTKAAGFFERSLAAGPPTVIRYSNLGDAYRQLGRTGESAVAYRHAMDLAEQEVARNPRQASSRVFLGLVAAHLGDRRRADAELSQSLAMEPDNATVIREAALGYEAMHEREKALSVLARGSYGLLAELSRQPDVKDLQQDPRFREMLLASQRR